MTNKELSDYWIKSSDEDYETMKILYKSKKYTWSLFFGHLVIEKILKGIYAKYNIENPFAPKTHDLLYLAKKLKMKLNETQEKKLELITSFNINSRYDSYKNDFYNKCNFEYTRKQIKNIKELRKWLKEQ